MQRRELLENEKYFSYYSKVYQEIEHLILEVKKVTIQFDRFQE